MWVPSKWYKILTSGGFDVFDLTGNEMFEIHIDEAGQMTRSVLNIDMMVTILMMTILVVLYMVMLLMVILDMMTMVDLIVIVLL